MDGQVEMLTEEIKLEKNKKHTIEVVVDRLKMRPKIQNRLADSLETALDLGDGLVLVDVLESDDEYIFSQNYACIECGFSFEELTPRMFSFNSPYGACPTCDGLGEQKELFGGFLLYLIKIYLFLRGLFLPGAETRMDIMLSFLNLLVLTLVLTWINLTKS